MLKVETIGHAVLLAASLVGFAGVVFSGYFSYRASKDAKTASVEAEEANDAVNHRHITGTKRLYDIALELQRDMAELKSWKTRWDSLDWDISSGERMSNRLRELDLALERNDLAHEEIMRLIHIHFGNGGSHD